ncbi:non-specific lipid-transfer protein Cw18-like [Cucumis sativus]|uniref:Non-specific lipid-transfer protein n=1 Tax=Cucumis sativus TaxID=3659 RepID=A0A0A0L5X1_CUCSA|nr:non-specific lipid-transfer protein Cw18-like [Cucumis sativus]
MSGIFNIRSLAFVAVFTCSLMVVLSQNEDLESCVPVAQALAPCLGFIKGNGKPSASCCSGVKQLARDTKTKKDKVALCECVKKSLSVIGTYDPSRIPLIPKQCGVSVQIPPIKNSTDCSK